jgi:uncharacterized SAM-binding protein YcdF (DUF218 family)
MGAATRALAGLVGLFAATWLLAITAVHVYGSRDEAQPADVIVVLGAAQYDGRPSPVLRARLDHALDLYRDDVAPMLIMTGGMAPGDTVSEAAVGRRYAVRRGVPEDAVLTERAGESSEESLRAVAALMRRQGMESAVLVSDPFHMLRLRILAARFGIRAFSSPTRSSPIYGNARQQWRHTLRESVGLPWTIFEGAHLLPPDHVLRRIRDALPG